MADPRLDAIRAQAAAYPDGDLAYTLAQLDAARASAETLLSILDAMGRRLTPAEGAAVAREIAASVRPKEQAEKDLADLRKEAREVIALYEAAPDGWQHFDDGRQVLEHDAKCLGWYAFANLDRLVRGSRG